MSLTVEKRTVVDNRPKRLDACISFLVSDDWQNKGRARARPNFLEAEYEDYAAEAVAARRFSTGASSPSQRTLTSFDTPGSCMVTP